MLPSANTSRLYGAQISLMGNVRTVKNVAQDSHRCDSAYIFIMLLLGNKAYESLRHNCVSVYTNMIKSFRKNCLFVYFDISLI